MDLLPNRENAEKAEEEFLDEFLLLCRHYSQLLDFYIRLPSVLPNPFPTELENSICVLEKSRALSVMFSLEKTTRIESEI